MKKMDEHKAVIPLEEYNELLKFKENIEAGKCLTVVTNGSIWYPSNNRAPYYDTYKRIDLYTTEQVIVLLRKEVEIAGLNRQQAEQYKQLMKDEVESLKKMTCCQFRKWRKNERSTSI